MSILILSILALAATEIVARYAKFKERSLRLENERKLKKQLEKTESAARYYKMMYEMKK